MNEQPGIPPARRRVALSTWIGLGLATLWLIISLATSGIPGLLIGAGVIGFFTGLYVVITTRPSWLALSGRKAGAILLAAATVVTFAGASIAPHRSGTTLSSVSDSSNSDSEPDDTLTATARPLPVVEKPKLTTKQVIETQPIPFTESVVDDPGLAAGTRAVSVTGQNGTRTITYRVDYTDGVETGRTVLSDVVTVAPVTQVVANGTYVAPPPAPAPFAAGGCGNGPAYVSGPVYVVGSDIYDLDRNGDGVACD